MRLGEDLSSTPDSMCQHVSQRSVNGRIYLPTSKSQPCGCQLDGHSRSEDERYIEADLAGLSAAQVDCGGPDLQEHESDRRG